jgi:ABC-type uncharacterized transport system permease subunit
MISEPNWGQFVAYYPGLILVNQLTCAQTNWTVGDVIRHGDMNALLGVYLVVNALRGLFVGPSLDALAGMDGEAWSGKLDFTLLRPVDVQFQASFRQSRPFALVDLALGLGVLGMALAGLVFWSPGFLFTWISDGRIWTHAQKSHPRSHGPRMALKIVDRWRAYLIPASSATPLLRPMR